MDEPWEQDVKWNKPVTKGQILYDSTHEIFRVVKVTETESRMVVARGWGEEVMWGYCLMSTEFQFGKMKTF